MAQQQMIDHMHGDICGFRICSVSPLASWI
jgi:hypothetical protein